MGSRWYRAPEISLVERHYDQASDLWSFGCILYEMIQYTTRDHPLDDRSFMKYRHLFKGNSCYPLSPIRRKLNINVGDTEKKVNYVDK